jgi:chromosome segregation ATPase
VRIYTYGTTGVKGSTGFDPFILGHLKRKHKMRTSLLSKDMSVRRLEEEIDSPAFSYAQLEALLTGDDRIMELCKMETEQQVKMQLWRAAEQDVYRMKHERYDGQGIPSLESSIRQLNNRLQYLAPDMERALQHIEQGLTAENFLVTIQDQELTNPLDAAKAFAELGSQLLASNHFDQWVSIGAYGGFDICVAASQGRQVFMELRGEVDNWRVRFTQNPYTFANDRRLQAAYDGILDKQHELQRDIEQNTQKLAGIRQNLETQEAQMIVMRTDVQALELGIANLREELGYTAP